jgi:site-specific DNA-adenine methylase
MYQGSKARFAVAIVNALEVRFGAASSWTHFYDLCCGTASVASEVARRAPALPVTVVDAGPWGDFWATFQSDRAAVLAAIQALYAGQPDTGTICRLLNDKPKAADDAERAAQFITILRAQYMGRLPTDGDGKWHATCTTRTAGKTPAFLLNRLKRTPRFRGVHAYAEHMRPAAQSVVYIDPGYHGLTSGHYNDTCDVARVLAVGKLQGVKGFAISHHKAYPGVEATPVTVTSERCHDDVCRKELLLFPA